MADLTALSISGGGNPNQDIAVSYTLTDGANDSAVTWTRNGRRQMRVYLPTHGGAANAVSDYSGWGWSLDVGAAVAYNSTGAGDGTGCLEFDYASSATSYIRAKGLMSGKSYTKSAFIRMDTTGSPPQNIMSGSSATAGHAFWAPAGELYQLSAGHGALPLTDVQDPVALVNATWYHVCVTYNHITKTMVLYKNGLQVDSATGIEPCDDCDLYVGNYGDRSYSFNGDMEDIRFYECPLTATQVANLAARNIDTIDSDCHDPHDVYSAHVTPFDTTSAGPTYATADLTVLRDGGSNTLESISITPSSTPANEDSSITVAYTETGTTVATAIAWYKDINNEPMHALYMPMEGGLTEALNDFSGNGLVGVNGGGVTWAATGSNNNTGRLVFDGGATSDIDLGDPMPEDYGAYTLIAWVRREGTGKVNILSGGLHAFWAPDIATPAFALSSGHGGSYNDVVDTVALTLNTWFHVAVTYDGDGTMKLYKNGSLIDTATGVANYGTTDRQLWAGSFNGSNNLIGSLGEVLIAHRAMTDAEISNHHTNGMTVIPADGTNRFDTVYARLHPFSAADVGIPYLTEMLYIKHLHSSAMCLGDSISYGVGSTLSDGYRSDLNGYLTTDDASIDFVGSQNNGNLTFDDDHEGYPGNSVDEIIPLSNILLERNKADKIFLHIGTNDLGTQTPAQVMAELVVLLDNLFAWQTLNYHTITVYLAQIINKSVPDANWTAYNALIATEAEARWNAGQDVILVDQENALTYPTDFFDSLHPNDAGYAKMATAWYGEYYYQRFNPSGAGMALGLGLHL